MAVSADDRARLHAALDRSIAEIEAGNTIPFEVVMASLRAKRGRINDVGGKAERAPEDLKVGVDV